jgi:L-alanine-DL-glutamate epimerase-like enolase superfamily enzyme
MELDRIENDLMNVLTKPKIQPNQNGLVEIPDRPGLGIEIDEMDLQNYIVKS